MKAVILARVSTEKQENQGCSLEAQEQNLQIYAKQKGFDVIKVFSFSETAGAKIRSQFEQLITYLKKNKDVRILLAENVDRLTRNLKDAVDIDELRVKENLEIHLRQDNLILNVSSRGNDILLWDIKVVVARQMLCRVREDTIRGMEQKLKNGEIVYKAPVGYENIRDKITNKASVIVDKDRSFFVQKAFSDYSTGNYSLNEMTQKLKKQGLTNPKTGKALHNSNVHKMLSDKFYCGYMVVKDKEYKHNYETLIDEYTYRKCQEVTASRHKVPFKQTDKPFIFRGLVECASCGCRITTDQKKAKYNYLYCNAKYNPEIMCKSERVKEEGLLEQIKSVFKQISVPKDVLETIKDQLKKSLEAKTKFHKEHLEDLRSEYDEIQSKLDTLLELCISKSITQSEHNKKAYELKQRQQDIDLLCQNYTEADKKFSLTVTTLLDLASRSYELFESSNIEQKRKLMSFVFKNLKLDGKNLVYSVRKPFDAFLEAGSQSNWYPQQGSNLRQPD